MKSHEISRRVFIWGAAAAASVMIVPRHVLGKGRAAIDAARPSLSVFLATASALELERAAAGLIGLCHTTGGTQ